MHHAALHIIQAEHHALATVLRSLVRLLDAYKDPARKPDFALLRTMLFYIDEFPERLHHPKESDLLFAPLRRRCPPLAATLDRLDNDHRSGERSIRELEHLLLAYEVMGDSRREDFEAAARRYADFYLMHMRAEEELVFPAATNELTDREWQCLRDAFESHIDPLTAAALGKEADANYFPLFSRIVLELPSPIGLAPLS
jgi:hemerythrin-like domain-containing protein